ncbi:MAG: type II toxin-antitoxin system VapC family toxin [bacterium]
MFYLDTTVIVKLYIKEAYSREVSNWLRENNESIPLTKLHELEFINALQLKQFRDEVTADEIRLILSRFEDHEKKGIYYRPIIDWTNIFLNAIDLSKNHTGNIGSRSLDILHVASALSLQGDQFLTFDGRQSKLASNAGLKVNHWSL